MTAFFKDLFVTPSAFVYFSSSQTIHCLFHSIFFFFLCGFLFKLIHAWHLHKLNSNQNDLTNATYLLLIQSFSLYHVDRLDLATTLTFQYAIIFYFIGGGTFIHKQSATSIAVSINSEYSKRVIVVDVCFCINHFMIPCKYSFQSMIKGKSPM